MFYDDSILSGTKTISIRAYLIQCFMMTQFFQVLKLTISQHFQIFRFMMTQFFQVLKLRGVSASSLVCFMMTQFFQVLKHWTDD